MRSEKGDPLLLIFVLWIFFSYNGISLKIIVHGYLQHVQAQKNLYKAGFGYE
jgi:hypothetical protein